MGNITFKEDTHQYFDEKGIEYLSCTKFVHQFQNPFDEDEVSKRVAARKGVPQQVILEEWHKASKDACDYGTYIHSLMEDYLKTRKINEEYDYLYDSLDDILSSQFRKCLKIRSELKLYDEEFKIAGTSDLIIDLNENEFVVGDFKTNKSIEFYNRYGDFMLPPISHLSDCNYNVYSLQLSLYGLFYSKLTGKKCRNVFLMYFAPDSKCWRYIPANFMMYEAMAILRYHQKSSLNKEQQCHLQ